jgi:hypothetical protein
MIKMTRRWFMFKIAVVAPLAYCIPAVAVWRDHESALLRNYFAKSYLDILKMNMVLANLRNPGSLPMRQGETIRWYTYKTLEPAAKD